MIVILLNAGMDMGVYAIVAAYGVLLLILLFMIYFLANAFNGEVYTVPPVKPRIVSGYKNNKQYLSSINLIYKVILVLIIIQGFLLGMFLL